MNIKEEMYTVDDATLKLKQLNEMFPEINANLIEFENAYIYVPLV